MKREILYKRPTGNAKTEAKQAPEANNNEVVTAKPAKPRPKKAAKTPKKSKKVAKKKAAVALKDAVIPRNWDLTTPEGRLSKAICEWIEAHPHFKWSRMVEDIGLKKSNFYTQFLKAPKPSVKADFLPKMAEIMANYGFKNNP